MGTIYNIYVNEKLFGVAHNIPQFNKMHDELKAQGIGFKVLTYYPNRTVCMSEYHGNN